MYNNKSDDKSDDKSDNNKNKSNNDDDESDNDDDDEDNNNNQLIKLLHVYPNNSFGFKLSEDYSCLDIEQLFLKPFDESVAKKVCAVVSQSEKFHYVYLILGDGWEKSFDDSYDDGEVVLDIYAIQQFKENMTTPLKKSSCHNDWEKLFEKKMLDKTLINFDQIDFIREERCGYTGNDTTPDLYVYKFAMIFVSKDPIDQPMPNNRLKRKTIE